ncbi:MAG: FtsX-like permease family protein [Roseivirga sp.]|nr:FtsX-like permease family protein [Roseivirga sp.]
MFRNYVNMALRRLRKNRLYSIINVFGLAIGMTCFMLIMLYVEREFSFDEHIEESDQVFEVFLGDDRFGELRYSYATMAPIAEIIEESIPEVEATVRFGSWSHRVLKVDGERFLYDEIFYTDKSLFTTFELSFIHDQAAKVRFESRDMILSESEAIKLFGETDGAIGKTVGVTDLGDFQVTGVFHDMPSNSHMDFDVLISFENVTAIHDLSNLRVGGQELSYDLRTLNVFPLYLKLDAPSEELSSIETKIVSLLKTHFEKDYEVKLLPLEEIYFSELNPGFFGKAGDRSGLSLYILTSMIILILAIVNYANLATAQYGQRSKEVGVRKSLGGFRSQLIAQFISESVCLTAISIVLSVCFLEISLPWFRDFSGSDISLDYQNPLTYLRLTGFAVIVGAISGLYPALYLSKLEVLETLKGRILRGKSGGYVRQLLVGFQFFVCLSLITITGIVLRQFNYITTIDRGFGTEQVIAVNIEDDGVKKNYGAIKSELLQDPNVNFVNGSVFSAFDGEAPLMQLAGKDPEKKVLVTMMMVEPGFVENLGIEILQGSAFNAQTPADNKNKILVNQATVEEFGWTDPLKEKLMDMSVVGVLDNFVYGSVKREVRPLMVMAEQANFSKVYLQLNSSDMQASLESVEVVYDKFATNYPFEYTFLDDQFATKFASEQRLKRVFTTFSILAVFIAGLGMLGLSLFLAQQRMKEIGIRRVLGASTFNVVWLLNTNITKLIILAALLALPVSYYYMSAWLDDFANRVSLDALSFIIPILALVLFAWGILIYQSLSAARTNPVNALRSD